MTGFMSATQRRQQQDVLRSIDDRWLTLAEVKARVPATVPGAFVRYRLEELLSLGLVDRRRDATTTSDRWRRRQERPAGSPAPGSPRVQARGGRLPSPPEDAPTPAEAGRRAATGTDAEPAGRLTSTAEERS